MTGYTLVYAGLIVFELILFPKKSILIILCLLQQHYGKMHRYLNGTYNL